MKNSKLFLIILILQVYTRSSFSKAVEGNGPSSFCGYTSCHPVKEGFINVHIVPHTHDDVGWLKTVDQYFYGSKSKVQNAGVQYILDSVTDALRHDKSRRFIYVETAYFWKWWMKQHDMVKHQFKSYVNNGQLEFIGGAWVMNDEATTHYQSTIDQFTWGLRKLNETFGNCGRPKIGWQIDPFGHSREMASIFAQLGFDGLLLGRIDYQDKHNRFDSKTAETIWRGSNSLGTQSNLFTGVMYNTYSPPPGFCFDLLCEDEPIIDDPKSPDFNVDQRITDFLKYVKNASSVYATDNIIITMGNDFNYQDANTWFKNLDKLIFYTNKLQTEGSKYNLLYSTPSCYVKAVYDEARKNQIPWPIKTDDFFPYASDPNSYWTGYFTSRPTLKRFERIGNNYLQVCKQLYALTDLGPEDRVDLNALREAMGVMQHHDAVTGTEKENVAHDYARILQQGLDECNIITSAALSKIISDKPNKIKNSDAINFTSCLLTNVSSCAFSENSKNFIVTVYNPLSRSVSQYVRLPVLGTAYDVRNSNGDVLTNQLIPIAKSVINIPGRNSKATVELIFVADNIPPLGFKSYYVQQVSGNRIVRESELHEHTYEDVSFDIDQNTGLVTQINMNGVEVPLKQQFVYYKGFVGNNTIPKYRSSGAYIFRPLTDSMYNITNKVNTKIFRGSLVVELHQIFNEWTSQIVRIYRNENFVEFDWLIGPLPESKKNGIEVVSTFTTNLNTNSIFYTDSNGREMLERTRNFRPTWTLNLSEPISGNYYPVTSKIVIRDVVKNIEVAVLTDRAQGGSSIVDGQIELMVHRKCIHDDAFGVDEALMEEAFNKSLVVRGSHYVLAGLISNATNNFTIASLKKDLAQRKILSAWTFLSSTMEHNFDEYKSKYVMNFAGLKRNLPKNVQILTLEPWKGFTFLIRLEHVYEINEDPIWSQTAEIDLAGLFSPFEIVSIQETTLGANQWLTDNHRLNFSTFDEEDAYSHTDQRYRRYVVMNADINDFVIILKPMQIRTFVIEIKKTSLV